MKTHKRLDMSLGNILELHNIHPTLKQLLIELVGLWPHSTIYITSFNRTKEEDASLNASGIHSSGPPWRAIDVRIRGLGGNDDESQQLATSICSTINSNWTYDPSRPTLTVAYCAPHGTGPHVHLQCSNMTIRK